MSDVVEIMARAGMCAGDYSASEIEANVKDKSGIYKDFHVTAQAVLSALDAAGYAVVPKEPRSPMVQAGYRVAVNVGGIISTTDLVSAYRAMLQASQSDTGREG